MTRQLAILSAGLACVVACSFEHGALTIDGAVISGDGRFDAAIDAAPNCVGASPYFICSITPPSGSLTLNNTTIGTDDDECSGGEIITMPSGTKVCVLSGTSVTVTGTVRAEGTRPLVLVATTGNLVIMSGATLDVSTSPADSTPGAGANDPSCTISNGLNDSGGGGGGAGGSFGTAAGRGGNGVANGGAASPATTPVTIRGGCRGGKGGDGGGTGGSGGDSGGAVYLLAEGTLSVAGTINASGEGGKLGPSGKNAGGGGGSGGMVALHGHNGLTVTGSIFANGGGGGGGGDGSNGQDGHESTGPTNAPIGGNSGGANAGAGGAGAIGTNAGTQGADATKPGGGGGGGVGVVKILSGQALSSSSISPPPA